MQYIAIFVHSTVTPMGVVNDICSHGKVAASLRQQPLRAPPNFTSHSYSVRDCKKRAVSALIAVNPTGWSLSRYILIILTLFMRRRQKKIKVVDILLTTYILDKFELGQIRKTSVRYSAGEQLWFWLYHQLSTLSQIIPLAWQQFLYLLLSLCADFHHDHKVV